MARGPGRIVVVGGGIIGCGIAWELAKRGVEVVLVERGPIGREASWASAGIVGPPSRPEWSAQRIELGRRSLATYPDWVAELQAQTGHDVAFRKTGEWSVAADNDHAAIEEHIAAFQRSLGYAVERVDPDEARRREPALAEALVAAWFAPDAAILSVQRLTRALAAAAVGRGATVMTETPVGSLIREGDRITGVRLAGGDLPADLVVLAAGAWTRLLGDAVGAELPVHPVKGQLIAFADAPVRPVGVIAGHGGYVRPRPDGTTLVAATEEDAGFDRRVTGEGVAWLLDLARTICPRLLEGTLAETWSGLRPGSGAGEPMIGPVPGIAGLWVAAGHFRTGAKEAPATAMLVAAALAGDAPDPLLAHFAPPSARLGLAT
jgi:glycine oxidase